MIYIDPDTYECLDDMTTNLRAIVSSCATPEPVHSGLRKVLLDLMVAITDTHPDPNPEHRIHTQPNWPQGAA